MTENIQEESEPFVENNPVDYSQLLTSGFIENPLWLDFTTALGELINPNIQSPADELLNLRDPYVSPAFAALNTRMLGFNVTNTQFSADEYVNLMVHLGEYWLTRGAGSEFINFLAFIKNMSVQYQALWANLSGYDIYQLNEIPISSLSNAPGIPIWQGGTWFPTTYYDAVYDPLTVPFQTAQDFASFLYQLQPIHLVLRNLGGIISVNISATANAVPLMSNYIVITTLNSGGGGGGEVWLDTLVPSASNWLFDPATNDNLEVN